MIKTGLVSITFRSLSPEEIITLVKTTGLDGIEWGGDIHCPHGDVKRAKQVGQMTLDAGLDVAAYGSYYKVASDEEFEPVLESAIALRAPIIRVWAGNKGSKDADECYVKAVVDDSMKIANMAKKEGIQIAYEYHGNTLTDTNKSALELLKAVDNDNIFTYWQPPQDISARERKDGLVKVLPWLTNLHVFSWGKDVRYPLAQLESEWIGYFDIVSQLKDDRYAMIEFVKDDNKQQFMEDAKTLKKWVNLVNK